MKRAAIVATVAAVILAAASLAQGQQPSPSPAQCQTAVNLLPATGQELALLMRTMTAGDELALSTQLARCQDSHSAALTPKQLDRVGRTVYKLDADVISRMYGYLEKRHMADAFNDEEEAKHTK